METNSVEKWDEFEHKGIKFSIVSVKETGQLMSVGIDIKFCISYDKNDFQILTGMTKACIDYCLNGGVVNE